MIRYGVNVGYAHLHCWRQAGVVTLIEIVFYRMPARDISNCFKVGRHFGPSHG